MAIEVIESDDFLNDYGPFFILIKDEVKNQVLTQYIDKEDGFNVSLRLSPYLYNYIDNNYSNFAIFTGVDKDIVRYISETDLPGDVIVANLLNASKPFNANVVNLLPFVLFNLYKFVLENYEENKDNIDLVNLISIERMIDNFNNLGLLPEDVYENTKKQIEKLAKEIKHENK